MSACSTAQIGGYKVNMTWADSFVSIDTETTGFGPKARVIEVAAVTFEKGAIARDWSTLINPGDVDWSDPRIQEALNVNKIDPAQLKDKPRFEDIFPDLLLELSGDVWVAHNAEFDLQMLQQERARMVGSTLPEIQPKLFLCTKLLSNRIHPAEKKHNLAFVAPRWGVEQDGAHRASSDAITCGRILHSMYSKNALPSDYAEAEAFHKEASAAWKQGGRRW